MYLERSAILSCLAISFYSSSIIYCNPVGSNFFDFNDDWNSKIISNKEPRLGSEIINHELPTQSLRQGKENLVRLVQSSNMEQNTIDNKGDSIHSVVSCSVCTLGLSLLQTAAKSGESFEIIRTKFVEICVGFNIQNTVVCTGIFDVFGPEVVAVLNVTEMGPKEICTLLQSEVCEEDPDLQGWRVPLLRTSKSLIDAEAQPLQLGKPTLKVLQISDTHLDLDYAVESNANCDEPLCCRVSSSPLKTVGVIVPAGKWGSYKCDSPKILVENMLQNIAREHQDIDYIMWTGDLPPHDIWQQTKNDSLKILVESVRQVKIFFPNAVILPALGNHEGIPAGSFPPPWNKDSKYSIEWLYNEVYEQWQHWLPKSEKNTILHGGFYSVLIRPGFRVISLNTNYCHIYSWWLIINNTDPAKELEWLVDQLQQAENNGEKVHIIGHVPPGSYDCLKSWSQNYYDIINVYKHVVTAQFFGHTHGDEFEVFYDNNNFSRPINVAYLAPSVTPYSGQNPAYRIYYIDGEHQNSTWEVIDHETWIMDLDKANSELQENPKWFKFYSARQAYDMPNLRPLEWHRLIYRMVQDPALFQKFHRFYHRDSPVTPKIINKTKLLLLCDLKSGKSQARRKLCHDLELVIHD